jgi:DNA helicase-2/ATP-dependent DNA helicase PcrA
MARGYSDWDDPESYGNSAYGGGRYATNGNYGGYKTYGDTSRQNSGVTRSTWQGNSYGSSSYSGGYSSSSTTQKSSGFVYGGVGKAAPAKPTAGKDVSAFKTGVKVRHPKFGEGTIINARGVGSNMILDIAFEGLGIKQLSATLAPLTVVGS